MSIYLIYFAIILFSNTLGAISGMGGGVIIKPMLDAVGYHSLQQIVLYSSIAVFTMSISSTLKQLSSGTKINLKEVTALSIGSILGGYLGNLLLSILLGHFQEKQVLLIQICLTILTLTLSIIYANSKPVTFHFKQLILFLFVGLFLGTLSALLGIGGGPINVALLTLCFGLSIKQAVVYSIATILFSQATQLLTSFSKGLFHLLDSHFSVVIIFAALLGGYLGGTFNKKLSEKTVAYFYSATILLVLIVNVFNLITVFFLARTAFFELSGMLVVVLLQTLGGFLMPKHTKKWSQEYKLLLPLVFIIESIGFSSDIITLIGTKLPNGSSDQPKTK